jgi:hypothetical protein
MLTGESWLIIGRKPGFSDSLLAGSEFENPIVEGGDPKTEDLVYLGIINVHLLMVFLFSIDNPEVVHFAI